MRPTELVAAALLAATLACGNSGPPGNAAVGGPAPAYAAPTLDGDTVTLAELQGRPVLLNIWATWCSPCREEMPDLQAVAEEYGPRGLQVVAVSIDQAGAREDVRQFMAAYGVHFTVLLDPAGMVSRAFTTVGVPETFLIDAGGTIRARWIGQVRPSSLRSALEGALGNGTS